MRILNNNYSGEIKKTLPNKTTGKEEVEKESAFKPMDILDSNMLALAAALKAGEKITVTGSDGKILEFEKTSLPTPPTPSKMDAFMKSTGNVLRSGAIGFSKAIKFDKSFALKGSVALAQTVGLVGLPAAMTGGIELGFLPVIRGMGTLLDTWQLTKTLKDPTANGADKAIDIAHVITDAVGIAGVVAQYIPSMQPFAKPLIWASYASDVAAHGYHMIRYAEKTGEELVIKPNPQHVDNNTTGGGQKPETQVEVPAPKL